MESSFEESGMEELLLGDEVVHVPGELFTNQDIFREVFSLETWDTKLDEETKEKLMCLLPNFPSDDLDEKRRTIEMLFGGKSSLSSIYDQGENPLETFRTRVARGEFSPERQEMAHFTNLARRRDNLRVRAESQFSALERLIESRQKLFGCVSKSPSALPSSVLQRVEKVRFKGKKSLQQKIRKRYLDEISRIKLEVGEESLSSDDEIDNLCGSRPKIASATEQEVAPKEPTDEAKGLTPSQTLTIPSDIRKDFANDQLDPDAVSMNLLQPSSSPMALATDSLSLDASSVGLVHFDEASGAMRDTLDLRADKDPPAATSMTESHQTPIESDSGGAVLSAASMADQMFVNPSQVQLTSTPRHQVQLVANAVKKRSLGGQDQLMLSPSNDCLSTSPKGQVVDSPLTPTASPVSQRLTFSASPSDQHVNTPSPMTAGQLAGVVASSPATASDTPVGIPTTYQDTALFSNEPASQLLVPGTLVNQALTSPDKTGRIAYVQGHLMAAQTGPGVAIDAATATAQIQLSNSGLNSPSSTVAVTSGPPHFTPGIPTAAESADHVLSPPTSVQASGLVLRQAPVPKQALTPVKFIHEISSVDSRALAGKSKVDSGFKPASSDPDRSASTPKPVKIGEKRPLGKLKSAGGGHDAPTTEARVVPQETHSTFFSLLRDLFKLGIKNKLTVAGLNQALAAWENSPIATLNSWYSECSGPDGWRGLMPSAVAFLAGNFSVQCQREFQPYISLEYTSGSYQWLGTGRDTDTILADLFQIWIQNLDQFKPPKDMEKLTKILPFGSTKDGGRGDGVLLESRPVNMKNRLEYQSQEKIRFDNPLQAFEYILQGRRIFVGPVKGAETAGKVKNHSLLLPTRPPCVSILSLVRDCVARLPPEGGSRNHIIELLRDSQYLVTNPDPPSLCSAVNGVLDKLQSEVDPPVKYDPTTKVWLNLHADRTAAQYLESAGPILQTAPANSVVYTVESPLAGPITTNAALQPGVSTLAIEAASGFVMTSAGDQFKRFKGDDSEVQYSEEIISKGETSVGDQSGGILTSVTIPPETLRKLLESGAVVHHQ